MTIVCPKCMHKSADEEHVCGKCGALLLRAEERRVITAPEDVDPADLSGSPSAIRQTDPRSATKVDKPRSSVGARKTAPSENPIDAIKEALALLGDTAEQKPQVKARPPTENRKPDRRINRGPLPTIVVMVVAIIAVSLYFGLKGSSSAGPVKTGGPGPTAGSTLLFQFAGSGKATTGSFATKAPFKLTYRVACPSAPTQLATFALQKGTTKIDTVTSAVGNSVESGTRADFGIAGTFTFLVDVPPPCTWTISGST